MIICVNCRKGIDRHTATLYFCMDGDGHFKRLERTGLVVV